MPSDKQIKFIESITKGKHTPVHAGHVLYVRAVVEHPTSPWFVKAHDPALFTRQDKRREALRYLRKEYDVYSHLQSSKFTHIPDSYHYDHGVLLLSGLPTSSGWHWQIPNHSPHRYIDAVLATLGDLESIPTHPMFDKEPSLSHFWQTGWGAPDSVQSSLKTHMVRYSNQLRPDSLSSLKKLSKHLGATQLHKPLLQSAHTSHYDMRQSNIAWHPDRGTKLIDWSWASHGFHKADSTMFLIDLHKSGVDVSPWLTTHFSPDFAKLLIGYWLLRVGLPTAQGNDIVRLHQLISSISASELLGITDL